MLLEVLVAFVILTISLTALLHGVTSSIKNVSAVERRMQAVSHAQNVLARLNIDIPLNQESQQGRIDDVYSWRVVVENPSELAKHDSGELTKLILLQLSIFIEWREGEISKEFDLQTQRMIRL